MTNPTAATAAATAAPELAADYTSAGACPINLDVRKLREAVQAEYAEVATDPAKGFHFHTGRPLAALLGYDAADVDPLPDGAVESFAGVGNPWIWGRLHPGEVVVEVGSGAGLDAIIAARQVGGDPSSGRGGPSSGRGGPSSGRGGPSSGRAIGRVIGVDMTSAMLQKARANARLVGLANVEFREGLAEALPVPDQSADVITSNGVLNLCPDKDAAYRELFRALKPGGRLQIADIIVRRAVPRDAREDIDLWTG
jgi:SAM-dependent methyltransferase